MNRTLWMADRVTTSKTRRAEGELLLAETLSRTPADPLVAGMVINAGDAHYWSIPRDVETAMIILLRRRHREFLPARHRGTGDVIRLSPVVGPVVGDAVVRVIREIVPFGDELDPEAPAPQCEPFDETAFDRPRLP